MPVPSLVCPRGPFDDHLFVHAASAERLVIIEMVHRTNRRKPRRIVGGVDTHGGTHHVAVEFMNGSRVADREFPATVEGERQVLEWLGGHGRIYAVGVEGTGSYGAGLARLLRAGGVRVIEVNRPDRRQRRSKGKSDPLDAYAAADAVLSQRATAVPKARNGVVESIRAIHATRRGAVKARTAAINELKSMIVTAPDELRRRLRDLRTDTLIASCLHLRPGTDPADPAASTKSALRRLARRYRYLSDEIDAADADLATLVTTARPQLPASFGVGTETAAQLLITAGDNPERLDSEAAFAALCGVSPIPASSGKTNRNRLNRGGDRQANRALHMITLVRMAHDPRTRAYVAKRTAHGKTKKEIIRCLKRYTAREIYKLLTSPNANPKDLQEAA